MTQCRHCGTTCPSGNPHAGFCCAGCRSVHALIYDSGLEDFYQRQDRAGRPVGAADRSFPKPLSSERLLERSRLTDRGRAATLYLSGMTCRGCAWLIERIAARFPGVRAARVSLTSGRLELLWSDEFEIGSFQLELARFGYRLSDVSFGGLTLSPLTVRTFLSAVFAANAVVMFGLSAFAVGGESLRGLYPLLTMLNILLIFLLGSTVFLRPAWDALRLRHWHSDFFPALLHLAGFFLACLDCLILRSAPVFALSFALAVPAFLAARLWADQIETTLKKPRRG